MTLVLTDRSKLDAALQALGIDPATVPDRVFAPRETVPEPKSAAAPDVTLGEQEWAHIAPHLPPEPAQAETLSNRDIVEAVLWVVVLGKSWIGLGEDRAEAVRKRFARWSKAGVWQGLAEALTGSALTPERQQQLRRIAGRASAQARKSRPAPSRESRAADRPSRANGGP